MVKKAFLGLSICIFFISVSGNSLAEMGADTAFHQEKAKSSGKSLVDFLIPSANAAIPPGCYPAGTQCRIFIQNEVSCCGGQQVVGERIGWCIGWYDALPCNPLGSNR